MNGLDLVQRVTPKEPYAWTEGRGAWAHRRRARSAATHHVVVDRLRHQAQHPALPRRLRLPRHGRPATTRRRRHPRARSPTASSSRTAPAIPRPSATPSRPSRACSARSRSSASASATSSSRSRSARKTYKLKFGHRGANQPVKDLATGRIEITTQNHGFCVDLASLPRRRDVHARPPQRRHERGPRRAGRSAPSASSTTPKPPPARTTRSTCSSASRRPWTARATLAVTLASKIHFVSLGCVEEPRRHRGHARRRRRGGGWRIVDEPDEAEVIVVNTCGFIGEAKKESIDTIFELAEYKKLGACKKLVVTGCLSQRYPGELAAQMPEVDHFLGSSDMLKLGDGARGRRRAHARRQPGRLGRPGDATRASSRSRARARTLKIAEGCNRTCAFCVIPQIRGKQRSRTADDVVRRGRAARRRAAPSS